MLRIYTKIEIEHHFVHISFIEPDAIVSDNRKRLSETCYLCFDFICLFILYGFWFTIIVYVLN